MKTYDYDAEIFDGDVYCVECLPDNVCNIDCYNNGDVRPIFAGEEWSYVPVCCECGYEHDYMIILEEKMNRYKVSSFDLDENFEIEALNDFHAVYCATKECCRIGVRLDNIYDVTNQDNRRCVFDTINTYLKLQDLGLGRNLWV